MAKHTIIIAENDIEYVFPLELKYLEEIPKDTELEVITDENYFKNFFAKPVKADILIISEDLYSPELKAHNINHIFILCENSDNSLSNDNVQMINKYTSLKYIFNQVMFSLSGEVLAETQTEKETEVIMVYSAIGGSGKTSIALGLAAGLTQNFKRVLFVDAEWIQNAHYFFKNQSKLSIEILRQLHSGKTQFYQILSSHIRNEKFDYLPPFKASLTALNLNYKFFIKFIQEVKSAKKYDYIVIDTDSVFDEWKSELLEMSNKMILILKQDEYSVMKTNMLFNSMDVLDDSKILCICNAYRNDRRNVLVEENLKYMINIYIEFTEKETPLTIDDLIKIDGIQKLIFEII